MSEKLTRQLAKSMTGQSYDDIINATLNLAANALRQKHVRWDAASEELDDIFRRTKDALRKDYDLRTGTRRNHILIPDAKVAHALGLVN